MLVMFQQKSLSLSSELEEIQFHHNCISYSDLGVYQLLNFSHITNMLSCCMRHHTLHMIMLMSFSFASWCVSMNSVYHFIQGLLLSLNFLWTFYLLSNFYLIKDVRPHLPVSNPCHAHNPFFDPAFKFRCKFCRWPLLLSHWHLSIQLVTYS